MNAINTNLDVALKPIISPTNTDLPLVLFEGKEGLTDATNCQVFYGRMSLNNLNAQMDVEVNSDDLDESVKMQRDVDAPRVRNMTKYVTTREDYTFPTITIVANKLDDIASIAVGEDTVVTATLQANSHRFIVDGQGRTATIKSIIDELEYLQGHDIGFKLIVTNTESIFDAKEIIRQVFADYNGHTKKPSSSQSLFFDNSTPFTRMLNELIEREIDVVGNPAPIRSLIATTGKIKAGQLWTYAQFKGFFCTMFGMTKTQLDKTLADEEVYASLIDTAVKFVDQVLPKLPLELLQEDTWSEAHDNALFTKALFANGLALTINCLVEEAAETGQVEWSKLDGLTKLPLHTLDSPEWIKHKVSFKDIDTGATKITPKSQKQIARVLCYHLNIRPTLEI